jgi:hypothetical protein
VTDPSGQVANQVDMPVAKTSIRYTWAHIHSVAPAKKPLGQSLLPCESDTHSPRCRRVLGAIC